MNRRSVLAGVGLAVSGALAGCSSGEEPTNCQRTHEVVDPSDASDPIETYRYEDLSSDAQHVFDEAVANGSYATAEREPDEFRYWDETASYRVEYENETYGLLTYSGEGCDQG